MVIISKTVRAGEKMCALTFIKVEISHQMVSLDNFDQNFQVKKMNAVISEIVNASAKLYNVFYCFLYLPWNGKYKKHPQSSAIKHPQKTSAIKNIRNRAMEWHDCGCCHLSLLPSFSRSNNFFYPFAIKTV